MDMTTQVYETSFGKKIIKMIRKIPLAYATLDLLFLSLIPCNEKRYLKKTIKRK
jgi:hypothetical protein